jgi:hypothetical protein
MSFSHGRMLPFGHNCPRNISYHIAVVVAVLGSGVGIGIRADFRFHAV